MGSIEKHVLHSTWPYHHAQPTPGRAFLFVEDEKQEHNSSEQFAIRRMNTNASRLEREAIKQIKIRACVERNELAQE